MRRRHSSGLSVAGLIVAFALAPAPARVGDLLQYASGLWDEWK